MEEELSQNTKFSISILTKFTEAACIPQLKGSSILELLYMVLSSLNMVIILSPVPPLGIVTISFH